MPKNVFAQSKEPVGKPKRNTFDLSFQNNLTMEFGKLYPVFIKDVMPGDSFRIQPTFGLRFMPMTFPVQTRMQANLHFFYVRTRNLWKDFPDFIGRTKTGLVSPYLSKAQLAKIAKTRGLGDYMGLPTTIVGDYGNVTELSYDQILKNVTAGGNAISYNYNTLPIVENGDTGGVMADGSPVLMASIAGLDLRSYISAPNGATPTSMDAQNYFGFFTETPISGKLGDVLTFKTEHWGDGSWLSTYPIKVIVCRHDAALTKDTIVARLSLGRPAVSDRGAGWWDLKLNLMALDFVQDLEGNLTTYFAPDVDKVKVINEALGGNDFTLYVAGNSKQGSQNGFSNVSVADSAIEGGTVLSWAGATKLAIKLTSSGFKEVTDLPDASNLYKSSDIRISALPFRAYESIYNAFYRNQQNDPYMLPTGPGGAMQAEYNKFIPTQEGGEDNSDYDFRFRNWEQDYLTSCVPSPQQGVAPLVGVSASGEFTFDNGDGTTTTVTPIIGEDGDTLTGIDSYKTTRQTNSKGQPIDLGALDRMKDLILRGISISDFRNVNALQRWLEINMRRGFRYKDQLKSHFGVDAKFDVLDMPEFIGGMSEPVLINTISQSVQVDARSGKYEDQLGSFAGQASILASSNHSISKYCDEHGYIIGIMSISPVPNYSQLMPKLYLKHDTLDYFFPEFGHIGHQAVSYREVCPIQSFAQNLSNDRLDDVFGYQRAWYDYLGSVDEVHGLMRTELRKFLINRQFDERPHLNHDFISIDPEQVNDVFTVTDLTDKIVGQIYFKVTAKRPIPRFGIPRLEA